MQTEQVIKRLWRGLADRRSALLALLFLFTLYLIAFFLPQIPVRPSERAAFNRWLAELYPRLGDTTKPLAALGFLTIRSSYLLRITLGFLALIVAANTDRLWAAHRGTPLVGESDEVPEDEASDKVPAEERNESIVDTAPTLDTTRMAHLGRLALALGGLLIIGGWAGQMLWGWREPEVTSWPGAEIVLADQNISMPQPRGPIGVWPNRYGLYVIPRGEGIGLEVEASSNDGDPLELLTSVGETPRPTLRIDLPRQEPEIFFAIPAANLIFRLNRLDERIEIQAYRSASGALLAETPLLAEDALTSLEIDGVTLEIRQILLPRYEIIYNPTALVEVLGLIFFAGGTATLILRSPIEGEEEVETTPTDTTSEEGEEA